jgi:hypothetical protein
LSSKNSNYTKFVSYLFKEKKIIDMSKGIAIQTILTLLLGILVVGIVVYLVYTYTTGPGLDINKCRTIVTNWCNSCMIAGWKTGFGTITVANTADVYNCIKNYFGSTGWTDPASNDCNKSASDTTKKASDFCKQFTG